MQVTKYFVSTNSKCGRVIINTKNGISDRYKLRIHISSYHEPKFVKVMRSDSVLEIIRAIWEIQ